MIIAPDYEIQSASALLATDVALSSDQVAAIHGELTNDPTSRGYAGKSVAETITLLSNPYQTLNPDPQGLVLRQRDWDRGELAAYVLDQFAPDGVTPLYLSFQALSTTCPDEGLRAVISIAITAIFNSPLKAIVLKHDPVTGPLPNSVHAFGVALRDGGVITQSQYDYIFMESDPAWTASVSNPSRLEAIGLPTGAVLTARDLAQVAA